MNGMCMQKCGSQRGANRASLLISTVATTATAHAYAHACGCLSTAGVGFRCRLPDRRRWPAWVRQGRRGWCGTCNETISMQLACPVEPSRRSWRGVRAGTDFSSHPGVARRPVIRVLRVRAAARTASLCANVCSCGDMKRWRTEQPPMGRKTTQGLAPQIARVHCDRIDEYFIVSENARPQTRRSVTHFAGTVLAA